MIQNIDGKVQGRFRFKEGKGILLFTVLSTGLAITVYYPSDFVLRMWRLRIHDFNLSIEKIALGGHPSHRQITFFATCLLRATVVMHLIPLSWLRIRRYLWALTQTDLDRFTFMLPLEVQVQLNFS